MRLTAATFGAGAAASLGGLALRSCVMARDELAGAWCGGVPSSVLATQTDGHCAGCALLFAGVTVMAMAGVRLFYLARPRPTPIRAGSSS